MMVTATRFGPYEIADAIGKGGMGEVYRARDTNLNRDVAVKVLPESFAGDASRVARFEQEAKTLATLNHPNIAHVYGLERSGGKTAIVMELVEGPTLADRIAQGPLPADEAMNIAMQIADALEAAHERGVVHRDLKPANVKVRSDGTVKVLDFGIAKAFEPQLATSGGQSPIMTTPATQAGLILGTAAYMSPEQARGRPVDKRTDIWAFGCVLYEMLTGQLAFGGEDVAETLARVIANETNMDSLPGTISPAVQRTLVLCLQKDVKKRIRDIGDVKLALAGRFEAVPRAAGDTEPAKPSLGQRVWPAAVTALGTAALAGLAAFALWPEPPAPAVSRFAYRLPEDRSFRAGALRLIDITRDGRAFVYNSNGGLYLRAMNELGARLIPGSEEPLGGPFFAPDGQSIAFFAGTGELKRIPVTGGAAVVITELGESTPLGASWGPDGTILFGQQEGIYRVPATGGARELVIEARDGERLYGPAVLPDGDSVLVSSVGADRDAGQVFVASLATGARTMILGGGSDARYLPTGHIVYAFEDGLFAIAFDPDTFTVSGGAVPLVQGVRRAGGVQPAAHFAVAADGTLVYVAGGAETLQGDIALTWVDRSGREELVGLEPGDYTYARVARDGSRIAVEIADRDGSDIWISDVGRPVLSRITTTPVNEAFPMWAPDGARVVFATPEGDDSRALAWALADGTGAIEILATIEGVRLVSPGSWTPDGSAFVFTYGAGSAQPRIGLLSIEPDSSGTRSWRSLIDRPTGASAVNISPDGEWIAYHTDDTGRYGVYIERFPALGNRSLISDQSGGWGAIWSGAGDEVFYRRLGDGAMMRVPIQTAPALVIGTPELLFESQGYLPTQTPEAGGASSRSWDLAPDGRFLMLKRGGADGGVREIVIVENWLEEVERLVPVD